MNFEALGEISDGKRSRTGERRRMKLTVHRSGRAGFSLFAAKEMDLAKGEKLLFASSQDDIFVKKTSSDERGYELRFSGSYYSIDMRPLLEQLNINYADENVTTIFDISKHGEDDTDGEVIWKLTKRLLETGHKKEESNLKTGEC